VLPSSPVYRTIYRRSSNPDPRHVTAVLNLTEEQQATALFRTSPAGF